MKKTETGGTQSIGRAAAVLRAVAAAGQAGYGLADVAAHVGIERPTAHRILRRLVDESLLVQDPSSRVYRLGPLLYELGLAAQPSVPALQWCSEALRDLSRITGDSAFLTVRSGLDAVCMDRQEGHFPIKVLVLGVGQRRPLGCGAGSIALMSLMPDQQVEELLERNAARLRARDEPCTARFMEMVRRAREDGYSTKDAPDLPVRSLGVALGDAYGHGICALSVSTLTPRVEQRLDLMVDALRSVARDLGVRMRGSTLRGPFPG
ncbi:IclR family transcriptional regulator [Parapusillimonas granuli]|uniref:IclR family transcriptional regulator n=1 Tax=Parapusillimonas granuli TaxID=380911 RepID=A0A853FU83_9BURK|nr:IclR family transcriptional regulator [Parapusillimonas granuli]MBB5216551.1 DNA-binding IclR family transcriptional regulator [Parapusillimonas granuli]MEB2399706.1 IclR family transcriptional regulator [Alcaligenaceae bacterium]NYT48143.1 IclR family transcriptional regulator [Parapusillimonas granuli]